MADGSDNEKLFDMLTSKIQWYDETHTLRIVRTWIKSNAAKNYDYFDVIKSIELVELWLNLLQLWDQFLGQVLG